MNIKICIIAFYKFIKISNLQQLQAKTQKLTKNLNIKGTILIAPEGINAQLKEKLKILMHS